MVPRRVPEGGPVVRIMPDIGPAGHKDAEHVRVLPSRQAQVHFSLRPDHAAVFIQGQHHLPRGADLRFHKIAQGYFRTDIILKRLISRQQCLRHFRRSRMIMMQGNIVHRSVALLQHLQVPVRIMIQEG